MYWHIFYRVTLDNPTQHFHEMFEVTSEGIFLRREMMGPTFYCKNKNHYDYRHQDTFKWFPRYVWNLALFVQWHNGECCKSGGFSTINPCLGIANNVDANHIENYPNIPEDKRYLILIS